MKYTLSLALIILLGFTSCLVKDQKINVLIVDGFSNHNWRQTTKETKEILEKSGLFEVSISTCPVNAGDSNLIKWNPEFYNYDVVIQNTNNINKKKLKWPENIEKQLEEYVHNGGGLYILHSANNAFNHWKEYDLMIGLGWRSKDAGIALEIDSLGNIIRIPAGSGLNTFHGPRIDALIRKYKEHPINKGIPMKWLTTSMELYKYAREPAKNISILSYAHDTITNKNWPVEWTIQYGEGRVYNSSMGHLWKNEEYPDSFKCIGFQTMMIRATEWLASGNTTFPVPDNFPTEESSSLRQVEKTKLE